MIDNATDPFAMINNDYATVPMPYCLVLRYNSNIQINRLQMLDNPFRWFKTKLVYQFFLTNP